MAAPRKTPGYLRHRAITIRVTELEAARIAELAAADGLTLTDYIRRHLPIERVA
jgi:predicted DNA binding CopG/RHH family protein